MPDISEYPALLVSQWHPTKNGDNKITDYSFGSAKPVWWVCENNHEWEAPMKLRKKSGCAVCSNKKLLPGYNDLATTNPKLVSQWSPKNVLKPTQVIVGTNKKYIWLDEHGHEWEAAVSERVRPEKPTGCPYCSNKIILQGFNDLKTLHPKLAEQWDENKNVLHPTEVGAGTTQKIWWECEKGHSWEAAVNKRVSGSGCHYCTHQKAVPGVNDLKTTHPKIFSEVHPTKNKVVSKEDLMPGSSKKIWWSGECGHEWESTVQGRTFGYGCPYCSNQLVLTGFNDLKSVNPVLATQWHPTLNKVLPSEVVVGSGYKAWWKCGKGHSWKTSIFERKTTSCPVCSNKKVISGYNDLATIRPDIATEWHPTKNILLPTEVTVGSGQKVWWVCKKNHEWFTSVNSRSSANSGDGSFCPECAATSFVSKSEKKIAEFLSQFVDISTSNRSALKGTELDIYIPSLKIGIEFNGVYWHSEKAGKTKNYHHDKWLKAKNAGIQLIQIWEDDWNRNPELIKNMLAHKIGKTSQTKIFARKTTVKEVTTNEAQTFLNINHIQGYASGSYYIGLTEKTNSDEIVSLLVLKKEPNNTLNIIRYATSANVIGGFTKLLSYAEKTLQPEKFVTFADHTVSDGGLYENNGFTADKELAPDYMYVINGQRKHKFGYRLKRFRDDPNLQHVEGLTERELADLNNLTRIWDAGKTRYVKKVR